MNGDEKFPVTNYAVISDGVVLHETTDHGDANLQATAFALKEPEYKVRLFQEIASYEAETKVVMRKVGE